MNYKLFSAGVSFAAIAVALGAFGAHQLKEIVDAKDLVTWETACRYQMYHALALVLISLISTEHKNLKRAGFFFCMGIFLFSGSLYFITLKDVFSMNLKFLGPLTPIGGFFFILGWVSLLLFSFSNKEKK
ncbi:MAG: DUF423 domain-containing protein [Bacteroidetes bacterium]|nr:DUF423 domain-containing protein [Bacteroidota bacterium]